MILIHLKSEKQQCKSQGISFKQINFVFYGVFDSVNLPCFPPIQPIIPHTQNSADYLHVSDNSGGRNGKRGVVK